MTHETLTPASFAAQVSALKRQMTTTESEDTARYAALADQVIERLNWAPALANGAAVIALAGIVGNVPSPDTALSALTWPLASFSFGAALGLGSTHLMADVYEVIGSGRPQLNANQAAMRELLDEALALVEGIKPGITPEDARERTAKAEAFPARAKAIHERTLALGRRIGGLHLRHRAAAILNAASIVAAAGGMSILLFGHAMGRLRLEHPTPPTPTPAAAPQVASPAGVPLHR